MTRLIRPNKSCQVPSQHIILDTETIPGEPFGPRQRRVHKFRLACASFFRWEDGRATRRDRQSFFNPKEVTQWIMSKLTEKRMTWVWSHGAMFDWTSINLWESLENQDINLKLACIENRPNFLCCSTMIGPVWFLDSCNWFACSLAELGCSLSITKLTMPDFESPNELWITYCARDVEILERAVEDLLAWTTSNDLGCLRISAPGQAMQAWRHRFAPRVKLRLPVNHHNGSTSMQEQEVCLPITHSVKEVTSLERAAYFQGTVRVNYIGKVQGPVYCLDVNSCYPSVMRDSLVPERLERFDCNDEQKKQLDPKDYGRSIAEVQLSTSQPDYPMRVSGHCVYPVGSYWTYLCGPELEHACERSRIVKVGKWATYRLSNMFKDFIDYFWEMRCNYQREGNKVKEQLCKTIMNSLAGKFGQRSHKWEKPDKEIQWGYPWGRFDIVQTDKTIKHYRSLAWLIEEQQKPGEHKNSFPAVAAWVTSLARVKMLDILEQCKHAGQIHYSAIDSIHACSKGYDKLVAGGFVNDRLGGLRLECRAEQATYRGIANYSLDGELHVAGLPRSFTCAGDGSGSVQGVRLEPGRDSTGRPKEYTSIEEKRTVTPPYLHGVVNPDGTTRPWILPLEELEMTKCLMNATAIPFTNCVAPPVTQNTAVELCQSTGP